MYDRVQKRIVYPVLQVFTRPKTGIDHPSVGVHPGEARANQQNGANDGKEFLHNSRRFSETAFYNDG